MILSSYHVFSPFTDILRGYGHRIQENYYNWDGCRGKMSENSANEGHRIYGESIGLHSISSADVSLHNFATTCNMSN